MVCVQRNNFKPNGVRFTSSRSQLFLGGFLAYSGWLFPSSRCMLKISEGQRLSRFLGVPETSIMCQRTAPFCRRPKPGEISLIISSGADLAALLRYAQNISNNLEAKAPRYECAQYNFICHNNTSFVALPLFSSSIPTLLFKGPTRFYHQTTTST